MRAPIGVALALALAAGCSGTNNAAVDADAAADADASGTVMRGDARPDTDAAKAETAADLPGDRDTTEAGAPDADARPDLGATDVPGPATEAGADADAVSAAPDASDVAKSCMIAAPTLTVPSGIVTGMLSSPSRNSVVSCQLLTQTLGPEAFFRLKIDTATLVEIAVDSLVDTFVTLRAGCGEDGSELTCSSGPVDQTAPPTTGFDAGFPPFPVTDAGVAPLDASADAPTDAAPDTGGSGHGVGLRARLNPGMYTILVDTLNDTPAAPFTLTARIVPPAGNAICSAPEVIESAVPQRGKLDLAGPTAASCGGSSRAPLYYAIGVPAGQRLTARVQPLATGDRAWMPHIDALTSCAQGAACLAQGHAAAGSVQQLDWVNNGASWRLVTLAVSSDSAVNGAQFDLIANVTDLLATCAKPTPLKDGMALFSQDISLAPAPGMQSCGPFSDHAYYYTATLLPQQTLTVSAVGSSTQSPFASPVLVGLRSSCDPGSCLPMNGNGSLEFQNASDESRTVIVELSPSGNTFDPRFDLRVSMPLPPAGISVTPQSGLLTSEAGQTATFTVALNSPPKSSVTIPVTSDTTTEGTVSPAMLAFDATNWSDPQKVTVTGVDDQQRDGPRKYTVVLGAATSSDIRYSGLNPPDVAVTNLDDDPGLFLSGTDTLITSESGGQSTFTVRLNSKPADTVRVPLSSSDTGEGAVSPAELTFSPTSWNMPQTVTVTGVDDVTVDGVQAYNIVIGALASTDPGYAGLDPADLVAHNRDDDFQTVNLKLLSSESCNFPNRGGMVVDGFGTLYIVLLCNSQLSVISSSDGGTTFGAPVAIPDAGDLSGDFLLAGGPGGTVYLAYEASGMGIVLTASRDGGLTWSPRKTVTPSGGNLRMAAGGQTVVVAATAPNGASAVFARSTDGGRTFVVPRSFDSFAIDVNVSADGQTVWVAELQSQGTLHGSMDAGAKFTPFGKVDLTFGPFEFGTQHVFVNIGTFAQIITLADPSMIQTINNTGSMGQAFAITVDSAETATLLNIAPDNAHTEAVRLTVAGMTTTPKVIGPRADVAYAVSLSRKVVATLLYVGGLPLFSTTTFP